MHVSFRNRLTFFFILLVILPVLAVAPAVSRIVDADGRPAGQMGLSVSTAEDYADLLARVTGLEVLLTEGDRIVDGTIETGSTRELPLRGEANVEGDGYRVA